MSEDTYKGESPGKKLARLAFWKAVKAELGPEFFGRTFYFLASREGGDVSVLLGLGASFSQMVAVEINHAAADEFARRFPGVDLRRSDICTVKVRRDAVVFLDFCSQLCASVQSTGLAVLRQLGPGALFGIAVQRGREKRLCVLSPTALNRAARRCPTKRRSRLNDANASDLVGHLGGDRQLAALIAIAGNSNSGCLVGLTPLLDIDYQSRTKDGNGSPFSITLARCGRRGNEPKAWRKWRKHLHTKRIAVKPILEGGIRDAILSGAFGSEAALLLNVPAATVAAWKAHATRGTYKDHAAE